MKYLLEAFNPKKLIAVDVSEKSLSILKKSHQNKQLITKSIPILEPESNCDLCYCNGVFHHIPPKDREHALKIIYDSLRKGGHFYFWENNPWNPATHFVMSRIPFDRNAVKVFPHQAKNLLQRVGFNIKSIHYMFIFPRVLKILRPIERVTLKLPFGCQYLVQAQKK